MKIGKYQVIKQLGAGAMGVVYLAEHPTLPQKVAIKLINAKLVETATIAERFLNEARAASQVGHPGIVTVHDFDVDPETSAPFIVMEYLEGRDLTMHLREVGVLDSKTIGEIAGQLADALAAAHAKGIIHRDLKPDNVYLSPDSAVIGGQRVKVLDFGIAKLADNDVTRMTQGGSVMGTPMYMAPEQAQGADKADARSDIYSLGCMLYQMATGDVPFPDAADLGELFRMHREVMPPPARSRNAAISAPLSSLIESCMAKSPEARPASMQSLATSLGEVASGKTLGPGHAASELASAEAAPPRDPARYAATVAHENSGEAVGAANARDSASGATTTPPAHTQATAQPRSSMPLYVGGGLALASTAVIAVVLLQGSESTDTPAVEPTTTAADAAAEIERRNPWVSIAGAETATPMTVPAELPEKFSQLRPDLKAPTQGFEIQQHEVSWGEFGPWYRGSQHGRERLFVSRAVADAPDDRIANQPATGMTYAMAFAYCESLRARLPTEAEWEWAARGAAMRLNPWGDESAGVELSFYDSARQFFPDAMSAPGDRTPEGVHDLAGSVFEMTADRLSDPDDPKKLDQYTVIRGTNPQLEAPDARANLALHRALICTGGPCLGNENNIAIRSLTGFRCVR